MEPSSLRSAVYNTMLSTKAILLVAAALGLVAVAPAGAAAPPPPVCPVAPTDPWHDSSGCCCCEGACLYEGCPPCPCPPPAPGQKQKPCALASLKLAFETKYKAVLQKTAPTEYPSKTAASKTGDSWDWAYASGWTSGFFPGLLWQLGNETGDDAFSTAAAQWTAGRVGSHQRPSQPSLTDRLRVYRRWRRLRRPGTTSAS